MTHEESVTLWNVPYRFSSCWPYLGGCSLEGGFLLEEVACTSAGFEGCSLGQFLGFLIHPDTTSSQSPHVSSATGLYYHAFPIMIGCIPFNPQARAQVLVTCLFVVKEKKKAVRSKLRGGRICFDSVSGCRSRQSLQGLLPAEVPEQLATLYQSSSSPLS